MHAFKRQSWVCRKAYIVATVAAAGFALSALAGAPLFAAPSVSGVTIRGKLAGWERLLPQVYVEAAGVDSHRYTWREPSPTVKQEFRKLTANVSRDVCVVALASAGSATAHEPLAVKVTGGRLTPTTIVLSPGSRLSFKNVDPFPHVLFETGNATWAANPTAPGSTREWAATTPGLHTIRDQLFPSVVMYVMVDPAAVEYTTSDHDGVFAMSVPPGDYSLKAFFDGKQVGKTLDGVHVGPGGLDLKDPMTVGGGEAK